uniref:Uncharacterized protein n=1 Tax=Tetranychus urticae TaxID=32264 RepID=T1KYU7_TETUR
MFCCLQRQGCFEPDEMDASGFGPPIPTILTFGGQRDPQPLPPPPVPVSATSGGTYGNSYGGGPVSQSNANNINTNKEPYSVINPKILTGSIHRPSYPHIETAHGGWPIGFESAISGKSNLMSNQI